MEPITFTIDNTSMTVPFGTTILEAADKYGIYIPRLCHHKSLKPSGACRMCIVEDLVRNRVLSSCTTPVEQDMEIRTDSARILTHRKNIIRLIMAEHPESCLVCGKGNGCELRQLAAELGIGENSLNPTPNFHALQPKNPFIRRDMGKCILCGRCIRACSELVGHGVIDYTNRGFDARPATFGDGPLTESECIFCGTCVSMCPTGALLTETGEQISTPETEKTSICGFCSVGCHIKAGISSTGITDMNPAHDPESVNNSTLCTRGHYAYDFIHSGSRLTHPMIRKEGTLTKVSWNEAISHVSRNLNRIKKTHGSEHMGFYGSSKCSCEENYYFKKIAAGCFESSNTDNGSSFYEQEFITALSELYGGCYQPGNLTNIFRSDNLLILGNFFEYLVPVAGFTVRQAHMKGIPSIHVGHTDLSMTSPQAQGFRINPGSELDLVHGILHTLNNLIKKNKTFPKADGFNEFSSSFKKLQFNNIMTRTGLSEEQFHSIAEILLTHKTHILAGPEFTQTTFSKEMAVSLKNLALLSADQDADNLNLHIAITENNTLGSHFMGMRPFAWPGGMTTDKTSGKSWYKAWNSNPVSKMSLSINDMIKDAEKQKLKSLYVMGENPVRSCGDTKQIQKAFSNIEFMIVQDILDNEMCRYADVILPGASWLEKEGSFINLEGKRQYFKALQDPPGESKQDLDILDLLYSELTGIKTDKSSFEIISKEISKLAPYPEQWKILHKVLLPAALQKPNKMSGKTAQFTAMGVPGYTNLGCGTRTSHSRRIQVLDCGYHVKVSSADSIHMNLKNGDLIQLQSDLSEIQAHVSIDQDVPEGLILIPLGQDKNRAAGLFKNHGYHRCENIKISKL